LTTQKGKKKKPPAGGEVAASQSKISDAALKRKSPLSLEEGGLNYWTGGDSKVSLVMKRRSTAGRGQKIH